jgi:hypothetical protein
MKDKQKKYQMKKSKQGQKRTHRPQKSPILLKNPNEMSNDEVLSEVKKDMEYYKDKVVDGGYRIVGPAQAMLDLAKPMIYESKSREDMDKAISFAQSCWNLATIEKREPEKADEAREKLLKLGYPDANELIDRMLERFHLMFPEVGVNTSFYIKERVLKEDIEEFEPFDESTLQINKEIIPPTENELKFTKTLSSITDSEEIDEDKLMELWDEIINAYAEWCLAKGVPDDKIHVFANVLSHFLDFLYKYYQKLPSKDMPVLAFMHFMREHYIRKIWATSLEKSMMPAVMKLFMQYLGEKKIISGTRYLTRIIESEQKTFLRNLKLYTNPLLESEILK